MISGSVVLYKIASTCLLILAGYVAKRLRLLPEGAPKVISRFLVCLAFPCYVLHYMPNSVTAESLLRDWRFPLIGFLLVLVSDLIGYGSARALAKPHERATFRILVAFPNWVFMAVAVCEPLFGEDGLRVVLLYNIGITFYFWTFGMTSFRSAATVAGMAKQLFLNPQTVAITTGLALAVTIPSLRGVEKLTSDELAALPFRYGILTPIWETIALMGSTALPLSIFQIGLFLGKPKETAAEAATAKPDMAKLGVRQQPESGESGLRSLTLACAFRLLAAPALSLAALTGLHATGVELTFNEFVVSAIIMAMPPAVAIISIVDIYDGAGLLAARALLWGSAASLATAPAITWLAQKAYALL